MAHLTFNGQRLQFPGGGILDYSYVEDSNKLITWTNSGVAPFDTFTVNGRNITSAITTGTALCSTNEVNVKAYGSNPGQWGAVSLKFNITVNSGTVPQVRFLPGSSVNTITYSGPGQFVNIGKMIFSTDDCHFEFITSASGAVNFFIENAEMTFTDGTP